MIYCNTLDKSLSYDMDIQDFEIELLAYLKGIWKFLAGSSNSFRKGLAFPEDRVLKLSSFDTRAENLLILIFLMCR